MHPHLHSIVPGGGLPKDTSQWLPSRANFFVPVKALVPIYRALFKEEIPHAALLSPLDPQVWHLPWSVHSQANPNGHTAFPSLAPSVCKVAISNSRIVCLKDRTVIFTYRKVGSSRPRTTTLDAVECIRRFLQHVLPDGFMQVRPCGFLHARCAINTHTIRQMIARKIGAPGQLAPSPSDPPTVFYCSDCGGQLLVITRVFPFHTAFFDTG